MTFSIEQLDYRNRLYFATHAKQMIRMMPKREELEPCEECEAGVPDHPCGCDCSLCTELNPGRDQDLKRIDENTETRAISESPFMK
jgi:hypothetical protein